MHQVTESKVLIWYRGGMPALNIEFTAEELAAVREEAAAAGKSVKAYVHDLSVREQQRRAFVAGAGEWYERLLPEFQDLWPESLPPELRKPESGQAAA
jgi:hypothetical protein